MGTRRKKSGAGAVTEAVAPTAAVDMVTKLGEKAWKQLESFRPENLTYVMDEARREGINEVPVTAPDGRTFMMRSAGGSGGVIFELAPEDLSLYDNFTLRSGRDPQRTLVVNNDREYRDSYHPAAYFLAQAQREAIANPNARGVEERLKKMQDQFEKVLASLTPEKRAVFERQFAEANGVTLLPQSIVLAVAATKKSDAVIGGSNNMVETMLENPSRFRDALRSLREYTRMINTEQSRITIGTNNEGISTVPAEVSKYEQQRYLRAAKKLQAQMDKAMMRRPKLKDLVTDQDKQERKLREQMRTQIGNIDVA